MDSGYKRGVCVWHRRAGKDKTYLNYLAKEMVRRVGIYYYFFPTYNQGKKILWDGIDRTGFKYMDHIPAALREKTSQQEMKIVLKNNSIFQIIGTDNIDSIMGTNPIGCVFSEFSLQNPAAWDYIRPILTENGGWAIFNFTPRGRNHAYLLYEMASHNPDWYCEMLTVDDTKREDGTPVITPEMVQAEREAGMSEELVQQEFYCSFDAALSACFFADTLARHTNTAGGVIGSLSRDSKGTVTFAEDKKGVVELWRYPYMLLDGYDGLNWHNRYAIGSDISEGLQQDYSTAYVYDRVLHEFVARMRSNRIDSMSWAQMVIDLSDYYDRALIVPERNGAGISVCKYLADHKANVYVNMQPAKVGGAATRVIGWTETQQSKYDLCGDLKEYFRSTKGRIYDRVLLGECAVFIKTESGSLEADEGFHDDCVIGAGLAIQGHYWLPAPEKEKTPVTGWLAQHQKGAQTGWTV